MWPSAQWLQSHDERHPVLAAVLDGKVVGWASLTQWSERRAYDETGETSFYVHSTYRGRGVGYKLKDAVIEEAPARVSFAHRSRSRGQPREYSS